ncbi:hypothetical protein ACETU7_07875 [Rhodococcus sp. 3Y1]
MALRHAAPEHLMTPSSYMFPSPHAGKRKRDLGTDHPLPSPRVRPAAALDREALRYPEAVKFLLIATAGTMATTTLFSILKWTALTDNPVTAHMLAALISAVYAYILCLAWSFADIDHASGGRWAATFSPSWQSPSLSVPFPLDCPIPPGIEGTPRACPH